jgi:threonyl-tRNA synthetase
MLHRVLVGSMERFVGGLIEHYAGAFPVWLAPEQVRVLPLTDDVASVASTVNDRLRAAGIRSHLDARAETLQYRVREGNLMKVPYLAVIGPREAQADSVAVSLRGAGEKQRPTPVPVADFIARVQHEIETRSLTLSSSNA